MSVMLTHQLVQPAFAFLKLASWFGANQLEVSVSSGKLQPKNLRVMFQNHSALLALEVVVQLSRSLIKVLNCLDGSSKSIQNAVIVTIITCMATVALIWSREFDKAVCDVILLLGTLQKDDKLSDLDGGRQSINLENEDTRVSHGQDKSFWKKISDKFRSGFNHVVSYLRAYKSELCRLLPTLTVHDMLTIIVPIALNSVAPILYFCIIIGEPEIVLSVSLLSPKGKKVKSLRTLAILWDMTSVTFARMNLELGFFVLCAYFALCTREMKILAEKSRFSGEAIVPSRNMREIWKDVRRLEILVNRANQGSVCFYSGKIMTFTCSVLGTFYIVRFGLTDPISYLIALITVQAIMFYTLYLGNAYVLTETMDNVLQNIKLAAQHSCGISRRELKQMVKSVRTVALKEAGFKEISNDATPEFVDFYVNQVIALVLPF